MYKYKIILTLMKRCIICIISNKNKILNFFMKIVMGLGNYSGGKKNLAQGSQGR